MWEARYPGSTPHVTCCVCGAGCILNMGHQDDPDDRRYCSVACVNVAHPFVFPKMAGDR